MPRPSHVTHLTEEEIAASDEPVLHLISAQLRPYRSKLVLVGVAVVTAAFLRPAEAVCSNCMSAVKVTASFGGEQA